MSFLFSFFLFVMAGIFPFSATVPEAAALEDSQWNAQVIKVADGDTLTVQMLEGTFREKKQRIRLYGIDCPEKKQKDGDTATDLTTLLTIRKTVVIDGIDIDRYERIVGIVRLSDGTVLQEELLKNGLAWVYPQYCKIPVCKKWTQLQTEAQKQQIGIWQNKNPVTPWEWRKRNK